VCLGVRVAQRAERLLAEDDAEAERRVQQVALDADVDTAIGSRVSRDKPAGPPPTISTSCERLLEPAQLVGVREGQEEHNCRSRPPRIRG
jgi:hypothetical protein